MSSSRPGPLGDMPFTVAEIVAPDKTDARITYVPGYGCSGTRQNEVIQEIRYPDGQMASFVIMRGLPSAIKAAAIAMILNAPEEG